MNHPDIYHPTFVRSLFDEMSYTYGLTNLVASLGFAKRWREQCVAQIPLRPGLTIGDLMTGMGESWPSIAAAVQSQGRIIALDFSPAMCRRARQRRATLPHLALDIREEDVLENSIPAASVDCVISTFGLKTLADPQKERLAQEIARILKPQGRFSLVEISVPPALPLRLLYMFYLKTIIPIIGKLLLGNPDNYRLLGIYTERFATCARMADYLQRAGLHTNYQSFFWGCATGVYGQKQ